MFLTPIISREPFIAKKEPPPLTQIKILSTFLRYFQNTTHIWGVES